VPTPAAVAGALFAFDGIRRTALPMRDSAAARAALPRVDRLPRPANAGINGVDARGRAAGVDDAGSREIAPVAEPAGTP
jgi:hypothetical protein